MIYHGSGTPRLKLLSTCRRLVSYARAVWRRKWLTRSFSDKILPRSPPTLEVGVREGEEKISSASEGGVYGGYTRNFGVSFDKNDEGRVDNETGRNARSGCLQ